MAAAYALARADVGEVTLIERGESLGGLAATFEQHGHFYPLSYHHINTIDRTLLFFLHTIGALDRVRWKRIRMLFRVNGQLYNLAKPVDFGRFPMSGLDKVRFARLMLRAFGRSNWDAWRHRSAAELIDQWGSPGVRRAIFEPLCRLKFDLPCEEVSGAWLGARLHHREGSSPLGYMPGCNWTQVLCEGLTQRLKDVGVRIRTGSAVTALRGLEPDISEVEVNHVEQLRTDVVVSSVPTDIYRAWLPTDATTALGSISYTAVISVTCAAELPINLDFYWLNLASERRHASAIFVLNSLNPTIGAPGEWCLNFVTHLRSRTDEFFRRSDEDLLAGYLADFQAVFGVRLEPKWVHIARIPIYSPILTREYENPPVRSTTWRNVYFAGNYRTFPSIVSTGTALWSGLEAAQALLQEANMSTDLISAARQFRLGKMRR
jgi:protoporphyrinogen oxidase